MIQNPPKSLERPKRFKMRARKKPRQQQEGIKTRSETTKKRKEKELEEEEEEEEEEKETKVKPKRTTKKQKKQEEEEEKEEEDIKEVKEEEVKPKRLQYRSNLYSIVSLLHDVKFNKIQSEQIQKSPFANMLFAITEVDEQMVKKSDPILVKLIETYERGQAKFLLAGKDIVLTDLEVGVLFGITSGPVKIHIATHGRSPETEFANRVFAGASTMHLPTMRVTIENILKPPVKKKQKQKQKKKQKEVSEIEAAKDLARLLTLYTIGTLFFPTTTIHTIGLSWFMTLRMGNGGITTPSDQLEEMLMHTLQMLV
ncbi:hypothetical protein RHGRI_014778 [Rhododendron griersonianum]|uniref:Uncharacterized protein n=1 Tax=Rhododendron griersonianum TaxID=479676 RepID=A0AAV6KB29_9ERIC|nr:hypothetical protein RHGRI_014778 [Rhododendron griersonianum]